MSKQFIVISSSILGLGCYRFLVSKGHHVNGFFSLENTDQSMSSININTKFLQGLVDCPIFSWSIDSDNENIKNLTSLAVPENVCLLVAGFPRLISEKILNLNWDDALGFHMSDLPEGRGRSPQIYTILNKTKRVCSCLFKLSASPDAGEIISKQCIVNSDSYILEDIFDITFKLAHKCLDDYLDPAFTYQDYDDKHIISSEYKRRYPKDSEILYCTKLAEIKLLIRAQRDPYPLPFIKFDTLELRLVDYSCHPLHSNINLDEHNFIIIGSDWKIIVFNFTLNSYEPILKYDKLLLLNTIKDADCYPFELIFSNKVQSSYFL